MATPILILNSCMEINTKKTNFGVVLKINIMQNQRDGDRGFESHNGILNWKGKVACKRERDKMSFVKGSYARCEVAKYMQA